MQLVRPLLEMRLELLRACPLVCAHCSANAAPGHPLELPVGRVLSLLEEFVSLGGQHITLTGGEPFEYRALHEVLCKAHDLGVSTRIFTSGVVFEQGARQPVGADQLETMPASVEALVYSIYSADDAIHDNVTMVIGSYDMTIEAIRRTLSVGIRAVFHLVPTNRNYKTLPGVMALADKLGVAEVSLLRFVPQGRGGIRSAGLELDSESHRWLREQIVASRESYPKIALRVGSAYNLLQTGEHKPCRAAIDQIVISADGQVFPCSAFGNFQLDDQFGDILSNSLQSVWERSAYLNEVRKAVATSIATGCEGCLAQKSLAVRRIDPHQPDPLSLQSSSWTGSSVSKTTPLGQLGLHQVPRTASEAWASTA